jgi:hypothetical protein
MQGCELVDFFCVNRDGRFSGEAFVVLGSEAQVEAALAKHMSHIGKRFVEVFRARRAVSSLLCCVSCASCVVFASLYTIFSRRGMLCTGMHDVVFIITCH